MGIYRKLSNDDSWITLFYFVPIYRENHKYDLHAITSRLSVPGISPYLVIQIPMSILAEKGVKRGKILGFHFRLEIHLHYYFRVTWAILEDFEIFIYLSTFFTLLLSIFRPLKVDIIPVGQKFELWIQVFDRSNTAKQKAMGLSYLLGSIYGV